MILLLAPPVPSPVSKLDQRHAERLRNRDNLHTGKEVGGGEGEDETYEFIRQRESLVLYKSMTTLCRKWRESQHKWAVKNKNSLEDLASLLSISWLLTPISPLSYRNSLSLSFPYVSHRVFEYTVLANRKAGGWNNICDNFSLFYTIISQHNARKRRLKNRRAREGCPQLLYTCSGRVMFKLFVNFSLIAKEG